MKKPHEPLPEDMPALTDRLRAIHHRRIDVPAEVDARILAAARDSFTQPAARDGFRFRVASWAAVAAVLVIGVTIALFMRGTDPTHGPFATGPGGPGGVLAGHDVTILDVFALARADASAPSSKRADPGAIDALAQQAVALAPPRQNDLGNDTVPAPSTPAPLAEHAPPSAPEAAAAAPRFTTIHITLDPGGRPLAAYQLRLTARGGVMKVVGIESGDTRGFAERPPYYDRAAENRDTDELVIAMFTTARDADLPRGPVRVATIHLMTTGDAPVFETRLIAAADHDGHRIDAVLSIKEGKQP